MKQEREQLAIIGCAGVPARYGGFETLAHHLVRELRRDYRITVYCSAPLYREEERRRRWRGARLLYLPFRANGVQSIVYDIVSILHALFYADRLLILGVSGCILLPFVRLFTRKKIIVNIDGLEWRRNKWSKPVRKFLRLSEYLAVKWAHADIADNRAIQSYTAASYGTVSDYAPYGADHVLSRPLPADLVEAHPALRGRYAFTVCRIEPENNLHLILEAFDQERSTPLFVVGNWDNSEYGRSLRAQYAGHATITLLDPIYDQDRLDELRSNCALYVHGHSAGGTNPSLVEAMYLGLPVFAFDVVYNRETTHGHARFFEDARQLAALLRKTPAAELPQIGAELKRLAYRQYTWAAVANRYRRILSGAGIRVNKPNAVPAVQKLSPRVLQRANALHLRYADPLKVHEQKAA